ncbi:MAG: RNA polymerase sporulation sigma factor SigK [Candidatus Improbicoccus pseudotrichonymphae]|uniref:RNA polymerase sigma factor n=1 Tax=Candidatus Improbicoccus pseudotrichonymphae TaxID=3033792 RepID=A0AA48L162_9FIRM|nr:MAG: RNA polymerase sporulation sigma factor SigK [Candidatus Improbicoccus pseudotrichonymphae]
MLNFLNECLKNIIFLALHVLNPNVFPKILSKKEEEQYISLLEKKNTSARNKLIEHNLRLVAHIVKKFQNNYEENEDLISIGTVGLIKGINTFNAKKGIKLSSYISRCIENEILMHFRFVKKISLDVSINEPFDSCKNGNSVSLIDTLTNDATDFDKIVVKMNFQKLKKYIDKNLGRRERTIIKLRYGWQDSEPLTQQQVAQKLNISRSYVSRIEKKTLSDLKKIF